MKKLLKFLTPILLIIMLLSLIFSFDWPGRQLAGVTGQSPSTISLWARTIFATSLGLYLISTGVAALVVPWVGITLIVIGVVLVTYAWWPWIGSKKSAE